MKLLTLVSFLCLLNFSTNAQDAGQINVRFVAGVNNAIAVGTTVAEDREYFQEREESNSDFTGGFVPRVGINIGIDLDYFVTDEFYLRTGLRFSQKGFKTRIHDDSYDFWDNELLVRNTTKIDYLDIPVLLGYKTGMISVYGGPILSFKTNSVHRRYENLEGSIDIDKDELEDVFGTRPKKATTGIMIGLDVEIIEQLNAGFSIQKTSQIFGEEYDVSNLTLQFNVSVPLAIN